MSNYCQPEHPLRPPNWREQVACQGLKRAGLSGDPPVIIQADWPTTRLFRVMRRVGNGKPAQQFVQKKDPDDYRAIEIYHDGQGEMRAILEARLLAGETPPQIAAKFGVPIMVVQLYELYYFDVRSRLKCSDFIHSQVLGGAETGDSLTWHGGPVRTPRAARLGRIAYAAGSAALDMILHQHLDSEKLETTPVGRVIDLLYRGLLEKAAGPAAHFSSAQQKMIRTMLQDYAKKMGPEGQGKMIPAAELEKTVDQVLQGIQWGIGIEGMSPEQEEWTKTPVELKSHELEQVLRGEELSNEEYLRSIQSPNDINPEAD